MCTANQLASFCMAETLVLHLFKCVLFRMFYLEWILFLKSDEKKLDLTNNNALTANAVLGKVFEKHRSKIYSVCYCKRVL